MPFFIGHILTALGLLGWLGYNHSVTKIYDKFIHQVEERYPFALDIVAEAKLDLTFEDVIFGFNLLDKIDTLLSHSIIDFNDQMPTTFITESLAVGEFNRHIALHQRIDEFCFSATISKISRLTASCNKISMETKQAWELVYSENISADYFLAFGSEGLTLHKKKPFHLKICNVTPIAIKTAISSRTLSENTLLLSNYYLNFYQHSERVWNTPILSPGQCHYQTILAAGMEPEIAFSHQVTDRVREAWFYENLAPEHNLTVEDYYANDPVIQRCVRENHFEYSLSVRYMDSCIDDYTMTDFHYSGYLTNGVTVQSLVQLPYYVLISPDLAEIEILTSYLDHVAQLAKLIDQEFRLEQSWQGRLSEYEFGYREQSDKPLELGVAYEDYPRQNVYGESLIHISKKGRIISINERMIYSNYGIYQSLLEHGATTSLGIGVPVKLVLESCDLEGCYWYEVFATYQFNTDHPYLNVDTSLAKTKVFLKAIAFDSSKTACAARNVANWLASLSFSFFDLDYGHYTSVAICSFNLDRTTAWSYQINFNATDNANTAGSFLTPLSLLARTKTISRVLGISKKGLHKKGLKRLMVLSGIDMGEAIAFDINTVKITTLDSKQLALQASIGFGIGLVFNSIADLR